MLVLARLEHHAKRVLDGGEVELVPVERGQRRDPVERLGHAGNLVEIQRFAVLHERGRPAGQARRRVRNPFAHDGQFLLERRVVNPLIEAAPLQRVVHFARAVRGEDHERRLRGRDRSELGDRDLELRQQFEQVAFELLVGAIDLVDQQDRGPRARRVDGLQQRPLDEERVAVELASRACAVEAAGGLEDAQLEELPRVVPLVDRVRDVQPFVALQTDEVGAERGRDRGRQRGLADARFAFEEQRPSQPEREEERHGEAAVGHVVLGRQQTGEIGNGRWPGHFCGYEHHLDERVAADRRKTDGGSRGKILRERRAIASRSCPRTSSCRT